MLLIYVHSSNGVCCKAHRPVTTAFCFDYTFPTPCCGYGPCNIFCCNCDGGCRTHKSRKVRSLDEDDDTRTYFQSLDLNQDGVIDFYEADESIGEFDKSISTYTVW